MIRNGKPHRPPSDRHADIFALEIILDAVARPLAPHARLLDPPERRHLGRNPAGVDADDAVFERFGNPPHPAEIAPVENGGEPLSGGGGSGYPRASARDEEPTGDT